MYELTHICKHVRMHTRLHTHVHKHNLCLIRFNKKGQCRRWHGPKCNMTVLSHFLQSNCMWYWPWHFEQARVKCKYIIRKTVGDFLWVGNSNFALPVIIYEIFRVKICMTLTLIFRMGQDQVYVYHSKVNRRLPMYWELQYLSYLSTFMRYSQSKFWWPLDWNKVKCKYPFESQWATFCVDSSNICSICHRLRDNNV